MTSWIHRTIIVPAAFQQLAQALCEAAAEGGAAQQVTLADGAGNNVWVPGQYGWGEVV